MTYEEALQIAIEELYDTVEYLKAMNKGFPRVEAQCNELMEAHDLLRKKLEDAEKKFEFKNGPINFMPLEETPENFERSHQKEREWVGLTTEEFVHISYEHQRYDESNEPWFDRGGFARAIEQLLKEKNT